jgi:hypothetical protein
MGVAGGDGVERLHDFPFFVLLNHRALVELAAAEFEAARVPGSAQRVKVRAAGG